MVLNGIGWTKAVAAVAGGGACLSKGLRYDKAMGDILPFLPSNVCSSIWTYCDRPSLAVHSHRE
jgi:hypothetical protein